MVSARHSPPPEEEENQHGRPVDDIKTAPVANLHAQAAAVLNIKALLLVLLELQSPHYNKWRDYVLLTLGRYSLADLVLSDAFYPNDPAWLCMECLVLSWLYNSISPELLELVRERRGTTARSAWHGIEQQFLGNCETWDLHLDAEFRNFSQGNLSVDNYCRKMKAITDALDGLGEPVPDRTLVLDVLRGLNGQFQFMAHLTRSRSRSSKTFVPIFNLWPSTCRSPRRPLPRVPQAARQPARLPMAGRAPPTGTGPPAGTATAVAATAVAVAMAPIRPLSTTLGPGPSACGPALEHSAPAPLLLDAPQHVLFADAPQFTLPAPYGPTPQHLLHLTCR